MCSSERGVVSLGCVGMSFHVPRQSRAYALVVLDTTLAHLGLEIPSVSWKGITKPPSGWRYKERGR